MDADHHDQRGGEDREEGRHCDDENDPGPFVIPIPWPYDAPRAGLVPPAEELNRESKVWQLEHAASIAFLGSGANETRTRDPLPAKVVRVVP